MNIIKRYIKKLVLEILKEELTNKDTKLELKKADVINSNSNIDKFVTCCLKYPNEISFKFDLHTKVSAYETRLEYKSYSEAIMNLNKGIGYFIEQSKLPKEDVIGISEFNIQCWYQYASQKQLTSVSVFGFSNNVVYDLNDFHKVQEYVNKINLKNPELLI